MQKNEEDQDGKGLAAEVINPSDLVDYQAGGIVSRSIVDRRAGMVTLFAFDAGEKLSEHSSPYDALVQVLEGEAQITISGNDFVVKAGQMVLMPANEPHAVRAAKAFKMLLIMIKS